MSLLEDIFLGDETGETDALERVIEGDNYDELPTANYSNSDENSIGEDEAEEDKRRVDPTQSKAKRVVKHPRFILNVDRLTGPRGIQVIPEHFKDFKFKGKGHEREDLDLVLKKLEHWAYRLYPKFGFEDCLKKIEKLGKKRPVMVQLQKIRNGQLINEEEVIQKESSDEENAPPEQDEFDKLLQQQIELARATTPGPSSAKKQEHNPPQYLKPLIMPKVASSPSINDEQRERMMRNRQLAKERLLAKRANENLQNVSETNLEIIDKSSNINEETNMSPSVEVIAAEMHMNEDNHEKDVENESHVTQECSVKENSEGHLIEKQSSLDKDLDIPVAEEGNMKINNDVHDPPNSINDVKLSRSQNAVETFMGDGKDSEKITNEVNHLQDNENSTEEENQQSDVMKTMDVDCSEKISVF